MTINNERIAEIMQESPTAEAFATYAACRERNARDGVTPIRAVRQQMSREGFHPVPQDLLRMFRGLERAGVGVLKNDEFKWNMPIRKVGEAAAHGGPAPKAAPVIPKAIKNLIVAFPDNREVSVSFTPNLTQADVAFLAQKLLDECK